MSDKTDHIVAGSGIAGLCAARLLSLAGRQVRLLEKAPRIGGSLRRFRLDGLPFDSGFHFTGGLARHGILRDMLAVLGLSDAIEPLYPPSDCAHRFVFESENSVLDVPCGLARILACLKDRFPGESSAVDRYFERMERVCRGTSAMDLRALSLSPQPVPEDETSLQEVLDGLTDNRVLKAVLSGFCMCYGTAPSEVSFANHARICLAMYESLARIRNGGDAFVQAFSDRFRSGSVRVSTGTWIEECLDIENDCVRRFRLNTGEIVEADSCLLTMHPHEIARLLPRSHVTKAFLDRIGAFEPSCGFFGVFGEIEAESAPDNDCAPIVSLFPDTDLNALLAPDRCEASALVVLHSAESVRGKRRHAVTGLEIAAPGIVARWKDTNSGCRPAEYEDFKRERTERIVNRMKKHAGLCDARFRLLDSATPLTYRDWLHSPDGSAYGIRQRLGQYNLFGKLPVRNLYAAGQSAVLPGVVGAMVSGFMTCRAVLGKDVFAKLLTERL